MKILVVGNSGREHALVWKAAQSLLVDTVFIAPGNVGTTLESVLRDMAVGVIGIPALLSSAQNEKVDLTIAGPEASLVIGVADMLRAAGLKIFGSTEGAAQLKGPRAFTKDFLVRHQIPTAGCRNFTKIEPALAYLYEKGAPTVTKADGLAAGKDVIVAMTLGKAEAAVHDMLAGDAFDDTGHRITTEELLDDEEVSFTVIVDSEYVLPMATSRDHRHTGNGDADSNAGGMGVYSSAPVATDEMHQRTMECITWPAVKGMVAEENTYIGLLHAGLMIGKQGDLKVIEFSCRFGDPETQSIVLRMKPDLMEFCLAVCDGKLDEGTSKWDGRASLGVTIIAGGYPGNYNTGDEIHGLSLEEVEDGKVLHADTKLADDDRVLTSDGRVLYAIALGHAVAGAQKRAYALMIDIRQDDSFSRNDTNWHAIEREQR